MTTRAEFQRHIPANGMDFFASDMLVNSQGVTCAGAGVCVTDGAR